MKLLLISGNFPKCQYDEIMNKSKTGIQFAADTFQWNLIKGFNNILNSDFYTLSAPFINPYPIGYKDIYYKGISFSKNEKYVNFVNLWGYRNISRFNQMKKNAKFFLSLNDKDKYIIVYSPHVPFLKTACYLKKRDPNIKVILLLPDLPQFVALNENSSFIYKLAKSYDIKQFYKYSKKCDKYIFLTKYMSELIDIKNKDSIVVEGIIDDSYTQNLKNKKELQKKDIINITYTGTLNKKYGIHNLIDAFMEFDNKNFRLNICGKGDSEDYVLNSCKKDSRIIYYGQLSSTAAKELQMNSTILVNPRQNHEKFTRYSFPSKILEYLSTGNFVVAYKLDGIPNEYDDFLFYPKDDSIESLKTEIRKVLELSEHDKLCYLKNLNKFLKTKAINETTNRIYNFLIEERE